MQGGGPAELCCQFRWRSRMLVLLDHLAKVFCFSLWIIMKEPLG